MSEPTPAPLRCFSCRETIWDYDAEVEATWRGEHTGHDLAESTPAERAATWERRARYLLTQPVDAEGVRLALESSEAEVVRLRAEVERLSLSGIKPKNSGIDMDRWRRDRDARWRNS